jgi:maltooligosyltrehalose synthase
LPLALLDGCEMPLVPRDRWADTRIVLPAECRGHAFHDIAFGDEIGVGDELLASEALARFPVALLHLAAE